MNSNFEYKGTFYLPGKKEDAIQGTLIYDLNDGLTLDLMGAFPRNFERSIELIHGEIENGKAVTLFNSFETFRSFSLPGMSYAKYTSNFLFIGEVLFTSKRDISFNKVSVWYSNLEDWLNVQTGFQKVEFENKDHRILIEYVKPNPIYIPISEDKSITIKFSAKPPPRTMMLRKNVSIVQEANVDFEYSKRISLDNIFDDVGQFGNFLMLCLQQSVSIKKMQASLRIRNAKKLYEVDVFYSEGAKRKVESDLLFIDMLVPYVRLAPIFPQVLQNWYSNMELLRPTTDQYFSTYHGLQYYVSDKFLSLARSLEAFHRDTISNRRVDYRVRIIQLQQRYSQLYNSLLKIRNRDTFAKKIVGLRNHYTHSNPERRRGSDPFIKLHYLSENIQIMIATMLLKYHGVSDNVIKKGIKDSRLYTHIRKR